MANRVLIAQFMHETNTFSKLPTALEEYRRQRMVEGAAICRTSPVRGTSWAASSTPPGRMAGGRSGAWRPT